MSEDLTAVFQQVYAVPASRVESEVLAAALGEEYPAELDTYSWVSRTELRELAHAVRVGAGDLLADVGCGRGGPGLWVAADTGCDLVGLDLAENPLADGRRGPRPSAWRTARSSGSAPSRTPAWTTRRSTR